MFMYGRKQHNIVTIIKNKLKRCDIYIIYMCGILLGHKKEQIGLFGVTWMDLESVIQNEVSQKEKNKYLILCLTG